MVARKVNNRRQDRRRERSERKREGENWRVTLNWRKSAYLLKESGTDYLIGEDLKDHFVFALHPRDT